jgi:hypothetical protein
VAQLIEDKPGDEQGAVYKTCLDDVGNPSVDDSICIYYEEVISIIPLRWQIGATAEEEAQNSGTLQHHNGNKKDT